MDITLTRLDGGLHITPAVPYITNYLKYSHRSLEQERWQRVNKFTAKFLYASHASGGIITLPGFYNHICKLIDTNTDICITNDLRTPLPSVDWERIKQIGLRDFQLEPFANFLTAIQESSGLCTAAGGIGKTHFQLACYAAFNKLNTIVAIPLNAVFDQTYEKFVKYFPEKKIGKVGGGQHLISNDITITTYKSLAACATEKCQLFLADEIQKSTGTVIQNDIAGLRPIRCLGFTATDQHLFSGADKIIKGLFGERLIHIPYEAATEMEAIVPMVVYFVKIPDGIIINGSTIEYKIKNGIKCCEERNALIGQVAAKIPKNWQTIIFVDHIADHLVNLHKYLPQGTKFIHRASSKKKVGKYALTVKEQRNVIQDFKSGNFQYLVATDCLGVGFDAVDCRVVIQGSSGSSEVEILQEAFRGSRVIPKEQQGPLGEKTHAILIDFLDNHDETLRNMAEKRKQIYKKQGWLIRVVDKPEDIDWHSYKKAEL